MNGWRDVGAVVLIKNETDLLFFMGKMPDDSRDVSDEDLKRWFEDFGDELAIQIRPMGSEVENTLFYCDREWFENYYSGTDQYDSMLNIIPPELRFVTVYELFCGGNLEDETLISCNDLGDVI